jgi:uncharacterized protein with HEPN domain
MPPEIKIWLYDIQVTIKEIEVFVGEEAYSLQHYQQDVKTRKAVERNPKIIGEAVNRIITIDPSISITDARKIVDTRNRIIHGYERVSNEIIWDIIQHSPPILK